MKFPLIVKPNAEGSTQGHRLDERRRRRGGAARGGRRRCVERYRQPALVEEYIAGREFTVGLLGDKRPRVLPPMEIMFKKTDERAPVYDYEVKQEWEEHVYYECPAKLTEAEQKAMEKIARATFWALDCRDVARVDLRMDAEGRIYVLEVNPLPGLTPDYSDLVLIAKACGMEYDQLIAEIMVGGLRRMREKRREAEPKARHDGSASARPRRATDGAPQAEVATSRWRAARKAARARRVDRPLLDRAAQRDHRRRRRARRAHDAGHGEGALVGARGRCAPASPPSCRRRRLSRAGHRRLVRAQRRRRGDGLHPGRPSGGCCETPILLTNTLCVGKESDAAVKWMSKQQPEHRQRRMTWSSPSSASATTRSSTTSVGRHIGRQHVFAGARAARRRGRSPRAPVGAGTGMMTLRLQGGHRHVVARAVRRTCGKYTVGALVLSNFGVIENLRIDGVPVGRHCLRPSIAGYRQAAK